MMSLAIGFDLDKSGLIYTGGGSLPPAGTPLLNEDGTPLLNEDGTPMLNEG